MRARVIPIKRGGNINERLTYRRRENVRKDKRKKHKWTFDLQKRKRKKVYNTETQKNVWLRKEEKMTKEFKDRNTDERLTYRRRENDWRDKES